MTTKRNLEQMLIESRNEAAQLRKLLAQSITEGSKLEEKVKYYEAAIKQRASKVEWMKAHNRSSADARVAS